MPTLWQKSLPDPIGTAARSGRRSAGGPLNPFNIPCTAPAPAPPHRRHNVIPVEGGLAGDLGGVARVFGGGPLELAFPGDDRLERRSDVPGPASVRVRVEDELDPLHGSASRESASPREPEEAV